MHSSISNVAPHWVCSSLYAQIKAAVFQVSKLCNILSRIQTLQQSFRYISKPCSIVFHVSKLCSSLSCIQSLQQSFTYPKLAAVFHISKPCQQQPKITDFKLCNTRNTHHDSAVALDGGLCFLLCKQVRLKQTQL